MDLKSSAEHISILVVIDTDLIMRQRPFQENPDPAKPIGLEHNSQSMICYSPRGIISGQGTAELNFKANVGDFVSFTGTSIYNNSDSAVIVYGIKHWDRQGRPNDHVFNQFQANLITRNRAVMPDPDSKDHSGDPTDPKETLFCHL